MKSDVISLRRFEWRIRQRGYHYEYEEDIFKNKIIPKCNKTPDFYVQSIDNLAFLVEVESFEKKTVLHTKKSHVMSLSHMVLQKRINRAVRNAADQLKPYADLGLSLVIVLDNHRQVGLSLEYRELVSLFGEQYFTFKIDSVTGNQVDQPVFEHQDDGSPFASGERSYISAVLVNEPGCRFDNFKTEDDFTIERPMRARIIHHPGAAIPLAFSAFQTTVDEHIVYRDKHWQKFGGTERI